MYENYQQFWYHKLKQQQQYLLKRQKLLRKLAYNCAQLLAEKFNVKRVCLVGSLVKSIEDIHENSDIDLVVFNLPPESYFQALAQLVQIIPKDVEINLIPYEDANNLMKEVVALQGEILFEK